MNNYLKVMALAAVFSLSCKKSEEITAKKSPSSDKISPASIKYVDRYVDCENATVSGTGPTEYITDNGQQYMIHYHGEASLPAIRTRASEGTYGLRASCAQNLNGAYDRSEITIKESMPFNVDRVIGFDMYMDHLMVAGDAGPAPENWFIFSQLHQLGGMPVISFELVPGSTSDLKYHLVIRNDDTGPVNPGPNPWPVRYVDPVSIPRNEWTRLVLHFRIAPLGGGYVKLYRDGVLKYTYTGKVGFSTLDSQVLNWRCGIYRTGGVDWPVQNVWFDEMKYGNVLSEVL